MSKKLQITHVKERKKKNTFKVNLKLNFFIDLIKLTYIFLNSNSKINMQKLNIKKSYEYYCLN